MPLSDHPRFTPVHVVTGFLGSGKTTLLARLLADPALGDTAVLINEFGEIGLDHHLLERIDETMVLLASGCVCCTIRGELADAIKRLQAQRDQGRVPPFRRLVIETTGLADPLPVITTLSADPILRHHFRMGVVVTTVDAVHGADQLRRQPESLKQVALADRLVLTKTDLATAGAAEALSAALRRINPDAPLLRAFDEPIVAETLLGMDYSLPASTLRGMRCLPVAIDANVAIDATIATGMDDSGALPHAGTVEAFSLLVETPLDWTAFGFWLTMLLHRHGTAILRVKGILNLAGMATPVAIHGVQQMVHVPQHLNSWPDEDRRSKLVFIVRGLDAALIRRSLRAFGTLSAPVPIAVT